MLTERVFRTEAVPAADRFDYLCEHISSMYAPAEVRREDMANFPAESRALDLGGVQLWTKEHPPLTLHRTPGLIKHGDPGLYHLSLPLRGRLEVAGLDAEIGYGPSDLVIHNTARPVVMHSRGDRPQERIRSTGLSIPRQLLPFPASRVDLLFNRRLSGREGIGALLVQFLAQLTDDCGPYRPSDGPRLGTVALDLVSALLGHALDAEKAVAPESRQRTLRLRVQAFVRSRLDDPELSPGVIAAAHHISVSYLHRIFEGEEETVAAWIRRQRVERARRELADPAAVLTPIHTIASRCGFPRAADFTRAFRTAYGMAPRDFRRAACDSPVR
ncbi:helix-turn-helix domain-containing protein [Kitasatospora sp. CM 4170]|uniref:Helix-turn-helix domain-containing protein n=1 Tax=Kitasatospora aburaviensis TaxID=67265 RepID=A0ABW1EQ53_9ACTN|nr:helix-turn-helix domain-containing protein [Kitasatospora sp. CM 4170]WNM44501.1 helix-turn-helix domain-containing protein [Kitasatospora sp. CM 4170]